MLRPASLHLPVAFVLTALTACAGDTPTQPRSDDAVDTDAPSFALAPNSWTARAPLPGNNARIGLIAASVRNSAGQSIVYVLGGFVSRSDDDPVPEQASSILAYNVASNTWSTKNAQFVRSYSNGAGVINGKVYIPGGYDFKDGDGFSGSSYRNTLWVYDPAADKMIRKADMPRHTAEGVSGVIGGKLYVLAGSCLECPTTDVRRLDRYDPASNSWRTLAAAPHRHFHGTGGVINGKFYVVGGTGQIIVDNSRELDVYDPATNSWRTLAPLPFPSSRGHATVLNGKLYIVGTQDPDRRTYAYNPATNTWNAKARFPFTQHDPWEFVSVAYQGTPHGLALGGVTVSPDHAPAPSQLYTP